MKMNTWRAIGAALILAGSVSVHADILSPGGRVCKGPSFIATTVQTFGFATPLNGRQVTAHFAVKTADQFDGPYSDVYVSDSGSFYYAPTFIVPKWYKVCVRNPTEANINVSLGLQGY
jgi:hypothetical protein